MFKEWDSSHSRVYSFNPFDTNIESRFKSEKPFLNIKRNTQCGGEYIKKEDTKEYADDFRASVNPDSTKLIFQTTYDIFTKECIKGNKEGIVDGKKDEDYKVKYNIYVKDLTK